MSSKKLWGILFTFFILASIPLTVWIAQQQQEIRQRASEEESYEEDDQDGEENDDDDDDDDDDDECETDDDCQQIPSETPVALSIINADINRSGCVNIIDFNYWLRKVQTEVIDSGTYPDVNGNGVIDLVDFNIWFVTLRDLISTDDIKACTS